MLQLLEHADSLRPQVSPKICQKRKSELGQFMTPLAVARFMAALFPAQSLQTCRLLDAGAGLGALSSAFLDRVLRRELRFKKIEACAYEIDNNLCEHLEATLARYMAVLPMQTRVSGGYFIEEAVEQCNKEKGALHTPF